MQMMRVISKCCTPTRDLLRRLGLLKHIIFIGSCSCLGRDTNGSHLDAGGLCSGLVPLLRILGAGRA